MSAAPRLDDFLSANFAAEEERELRLLIDGDDETVVPIAGNSGQLTPEAIDARAAFLLRLLAERTREIARNNAARKAEHQQVDLVYDRLNKRHEQQAAILEGAVKALAEQQDFGPHAKSRTTACGSYGRKTVSGKLKIVDEKALLAWALKQPVEHFVKVERETTEWVTHKEALRHYTEFGEEPEGTKWTAPHEETFVKVEAS